MARAEDPARRGQHDHADLRIGFGFRQGVRQSRHHGFRQHVGPVRIVQRQPRDAGLDVRQDQVVAHGRRSSEAAIMPLDLEAGHRVG